MISINLVYAVKCITVITLCSLALEREICQNSGMRDGSKPLGKCLLILSLFLFLFILYLFILSPLDVFDARKCQKILGKNAALWEYEVYKFKEIGQLKVSKSLFLTQFLHVEY